jgi:hypothetical protein
LSLSGQTALVGIPQFTAAFIDPPVPPPFINGRVAVFTCDASTQAWTRTGSIQVSPAEASEENAFGTTIVGTGAPVDVLGMTDQYLINGAQYFVDNFPVSGAGIKNLSTLTN